MWCLLWFAALNPKGRLTSCINSWCQCTNATTIAAASPYFLFLYSQAEEIVVGTQIVAFVEAFKSVKQLEDASTARNWIPQCLWDASGCLLAAEQICTEALNYSLDVGIPTCLLGNCSIFTPSLVTKGWMSVLKPFSLIPEITCSVRLCSSLLGALPDKPLLFPPDSSTDLGIHGGLAKNKGANCILDTPLHFRSGKLPQESNDVCCSCIVISSPELLDSAS